MPLRDIKDDPWPADLDYGQGKTRQQESDDSVAMLGLLLLIVLIIFVAAGLYVASRVLG